MIEVKNWEDLCKAVRLTKEGKDASTLVLTVLIKQTNILDEKKPEIKAVYFSKVKSTDERKFIHLMEEESTKDWKEIHGKKKNEN